MSLLLLLNIIPGDQPYRVEVSVSRPSEVAASLNEVVNDAQYLDILFTVAVAVIAFFDSGESESSRIRLQRDPLRPWDTNDRVETLEEIDLAAGRVRDMIPSILGWPELPKGIYEPLVEALAYACWRSENLSSVRIDGFTVNSPGKAWVILSSCAGAALLMASLAVAGDMLMRHHEQRDMDQGKQYNMSRLLNHAIQKDDAQLMLELAKLNTPTDQLDKTSSNISALGTVFRTSVDKITAEKVDPQQIKPEQKESGQ